MVRLEYLFYVKINLSYGIKIEILLMSELFRIFLRIRIFVKIIEKSISDCHFYLFDGKINFNTKVFEGDITPRRVCMFVYLVNIELNGGFLEKLLYLLIDME